MNTFQMTGKQIKKLYHMIAKYGLDLHELYDLTSCDDLHITVEYRNEYRTGPVIRSAEVCMTIDKDGKEVDHDEP